MRPSRWLATALALLGALAALAALASEMPRAAAWPLALAALAHGAWLAWREATAERGGIVIVAGRCTVDGRPVEALRVRWRGALAFVQWRGADGRRGARVFLPDTLPAARRRELRLAAPAPAHARDTASMAP
jgi:toxin CptA